MNAIDLYKISLPMHCDYILYKLLFSRSTRAKCKNNLTDLNISLTSMSLLQRFHFGYDYEKYIYIKIDKKSSIQLICKNICGGEHYYFCNKFKICWKCWAFSSMFGPTLMSILQWFQFGYHYEKHLCPMIDEISLHVYLFWKKLWGRTLLFLQ